MTETAPTYYQAPNTLPPKTLLPFADPNYQAPTWQDVRTLVKMIGLTGEQVASLLGVAARTVRKWQSPPDSSNHTAIPYSAWRLMLIEAGVIKNGN